MPKEALDQERPDQKRSDQKRPDEHPLMGTEIIVDKHGNHVTDEPWNASSYNYAVPLGVRGRLLHFALDMVPYFFFGNSPKDPSWLLQRIWRSFEIVNRRKPEKEEGSAD